MFFERHTFTSAASRLSYNFISFIACSEAFEDRASGINDELRDLAMIFNVFISPYFRNKPVLIIATFYSRPRERIMMIHNVLL